MKYLLSLLKATLLKKITYMQRKIILPVPLKNAYIGNQKILTFTDCNRQQLLHYPVLLEMTCNLLKIYFRSRSIANVSIIASFKPEKISLLNQNTEITVKICFQATFRPAKRNNQVGKSISMTWLIFSKVHYSNE